MCAQYNFAHCYHYGDGVSISMSLAIKYYHMAAEQGHSLSQIELGIGYYLGRGINMDKVEAVKWLRLAADGGQSNAHVILALICLNLE